MKFSKKTTLTLFLAGTLLFSSVALADVLIGSGYSGAKQALKFTAKTLAEDTDSFTISGDFEIKYDGEVLNSEKNLQKWDLKNKKRVDEYTRYSKESGKYENYYYTDSEKCIYKGGDNDIYHQTNYLKRQDDMVEFENPFEEPFAADFEKVADAFVSNMKDFVQIKDEDSGKLYFGSLDSTQLPAFVSALSSVFMKYSIIDGYSRREAGVEEITDIYISEANAKAFQNADGLLERGVGELTAIATDKDGKEHTFEFSVSVAISDINSTVVEAPDTNGKVEISQETEADRFGVMQQRDIGNYRGDLVKTENTEYRKTGEVKVTITAVSDTEISGHITIAGSENRDMDTDFTAAYNEDFCDYTGAYQQNGETRYIQISMNGYVNNYIKSLEINTYDEVSDNKYGGRDYRGEDETLMAIRQFE